MSALNVIVSNIELVADGIRHFTFIAADGGELPGFSGGSHVVVSMPAGNRTYRNAYSLLSSPADRSNYQIAVRLQEQSRGGSRFMHEQVKVGTRLDISWPVNLFPISRVGHQHILVAGGIGITPFMSQVHDLLRTGAGFELHYAFRSPRHAGFIDQLKQLLGNKLVCHDQSQGQILDLHALLSRQPLGTHVYVCGPDGMVDALIATAHELGWPDAHIHNEEFLAPPVGEPFTIRLRQSQKNVDVGAEVSMLEAMEAAGVDVPYLCRGGACGRCELEVLATDGVIEHHDHYLSDAEKGAGKKIMPCVSRAKCSFIELNL
ncbi:PDR/VanB family oxidoreductase [Methylobacillus arboreus]|uniref:PDR/VanB family oxidoreductase n=1 Tax=Methylobacillus arboreus TaxID=755170 RepID=UPI001E537BA6|nr:PDR/VanB family oxidoreductase [Methylobacillus arboreus]MCB5191218.1 PDR/VanB family oxidoreductase [Methylobacillus arboreus]